MIPYREHPRIVTLLRACPPHESLPQSSTSPSGTSRTFTQTLVPAAAVLPCRIGRESRSTVGSGWRPRCRHVRDWVRTRTPSSEPSPEARALSTGGRGDGEARVCPVLEAPNQYGITLRPYSAKVDNMSATGAGIKPEDLVGEEWAEWYRLTPAERFIESMRLWETWLALGGSLEPEPDTQSPFFDAEEWRANAAHGRSGVRVLRRGGVQSRP